MSECVCPLRESRPDRADDSYTPDIPELRAAFFHACEANGFHATDAMFNRALERIRADARAAVRTGED